MRKMHCPEGHTFDSDKHRVCPVCSGHFTTSIPVPPRDAAGNTPPPAPEVEPDCEKCVLMGVNGFPCGQGPTSGCHNYGGQARYWCDLYHGPGSEVCDVCAEKGACISQVGPKDTTCPGFWFVGWPENVPEEPEPAEHPEPEVPIREKKIKALLGTIDELEATESEKKITNAKITSLKESIIRLSREINDIDHSSPMPLFDHTAATAEAMENPKSAEVTPAPAGDPCPPCDPCEGSDCPDCTAPVTEPEGKP